MPDREKVIKGLETCSDVYYGADGACSSCPYSQINGDRCLAELVHDAIALLKEQKVDTSKYQYKYDHTDCIWYRDSRSKCPTTCSQYRDGWNDAMDFIFKNGVGYRPYKRR